MISVEFLYYCFGVAMIIAVSVGAWAIIRVVKYDYPKRSDYDS